jgi:hypothetical protein
LRGLKWGISSGPIHKVSTAASGNPNVICARDQPLAR